MRLFWCICVSVVVQVRMDEVGLDRELYEWYTDLRKYALLSLSFSLSHTYTHTHTHTHFY